MQCLLGIVAITLCARLACGDASESQSFGCLSLGAVSDDHEKIGMAEAETEAQTRVLSLLQTHFGMQGNTSMPLQENDTDFTHAHTVSNDGQAVVKGKRTGRMGPPSENALTASEKWSLCIYSVLALAAICYGVYPRALEATAKPRDGRFDLCKFWCMLCVVWLHQFIYFGHWGSSAFPLAVENPANPNCLTFRKLLPFMGMPGFTLISGIMTPSSIVGLNSQMISINRRSLRNSLRDLVLYNATLPPLIWILGGILGTISATSLSAFAKSWVNLYHKSNEVPLMGVVPSAWYLGCLFLWRIFVPVMVELRLPLLTLSVVAVICRMNMGQSGNPSLSYLPFFVLGFVLAGGGLNAEARGARLKEFQSWLVDGRVRVAAAALLVCCLVMMLVGELPEILVQIFCMSVNVNQDIPTPWHLGGPFTDLLRMAFTALLNLAIFVIIFAAPSSPMISAAGTRTLYVYLLHAKMGFIYGTFPSACSKLLQPFGVYANLGEGLYGVFVVLLVGSRFIQALTHPFVSPQWLADLLCPEEGEPKCIESQHAASDLLGKSGHL
jgi:hypothetical protein